MVSSSACMCKILRSAAFKTLVAQGRMQMSRAYSVCWQPLLILLAVRPFAADSQALIVVTAHSTQQLPGHLVRLRHRHYLLVAASAAAAAAAVLTCWP